MSGGGYWQKAIQSFGVTMGAQARKQGYGQGFDARRAGAINAANQVNKTTGQLEDLYSPYQKLSEAILPQLQESAGKTTTLATSSDYLPNYFNSDEFKILNKQASDQIMRNRAVTGLRTGGTTVDLANTAPTLGLQSLDQENARRIQQSQLNNQQFNNLYNTANLGYSGTNQMGNVIGLQGKALSGLDLYRGEAKAGAKEGKWNAEGKMHEDLASIWGS